MQGLRLLPGWTAPSLGGREDLRATEKERGAWAGRTPGGQKDSDGAEGPQIWLLLAPEQPWGPGESARSLKTGFWPRIHRLAPAWLGLAFKCLALREVWQLGTQFVPPASQAE